MLRARCRGSCQFVVVKAAREAVTQAVQGHNPVLGCKTADEIRQGHRVVRGRRDITMTSGPAPTSTAGQC